MLRLSPTCFRTRRGGDRKSPDGRSLLHALALLALLAVPAAALAGQTDQTAAATVQDTALTQNGESTATIETPLAVLWKYTCESVSFNRAAPIVTGDSVYLSAGGR